MSYTCEKVSSNKAKLVFTVPAEEFDAAVQQAYLKMRGRINVPGFRRGKAPRMLIERMYGENVFYDDALEIIFDKTYADAVKAENLEVVDRPEVNVDEIGAGKDLKYTCEVYVRPDVTLGDYKGLEVEVAPVSVSDAEIDARIDQDRKKASRTMDVTDRPVAQGDTVKLDYAGTVDGVAFEGGTANDQTLTIGSNQFIPGFEEQMVGMSIGEEKDLNVKFPEGYHSEELAGKDAVFHVKVNGITVTEEPELDDDFAADVSDFDTFAAYREGIVKELTEKAEKNHETMVENALIEKAAKNAQIDIPDAMIDAEVDYLIREMSMQMAYQGLRLEDYMKWTGQTMDDIKASRKEDAAQRVRIQLTVEAIRKAEGLEPDEDEIEKEITAQAERVGQEAEAFKAGLTDEQKVYITDAAAAQKVVEFLKKDAVVVAPKPEEKAEDEPEEKTEDKAEEPAKKPARRRTAKKAESAEPEEKAEEKAEEKPVKKPARRKTAKKAEEAADESTEA